MLDRQSRTVAKVTGPAVMLSEEGYAWESSPISLLLQSHYLSVKGADSDTWLTEMLLGH